jgi:hypothetical protein
MFNEREEDEGEGEGEAKGKRKGKGEAEENQPFARALTRRRQYVPFIQNFPNFFYGNKKNPIFFSEARSRQFSFFREFADFFVFPSLILFK